ncbi:MAG: hypothetical protein CM15mP51_13560 [Porticoccaceae bacterium]|nr:MAG: hypothetical protein CM15mP51_13560 [Porticoccaceae bacterium]
MSVAFLNNEFLPLDEAKISPLDRGFLLEMVSMKLFPLMQANFWDSTRI